MDSAISIRDLSVKYPNSDQPALSGINLEIAKGERVGVMGRSGSGKTTLVRCLNGLIPHVVPSVVGGSILVDGVDALETQPVELAAITGLVFEDPETQIVAPTVMEDLAFGPINLGLKPDEIHRRLEFGLDVSRLKDRASRNPMTLSGGEKQSLAIGGILSMFPKVLAMDEPISALDPLGKERVVGVLKDLGEKNPGLTIVVTEGGTNAEYLTTLMDRVVVLDKGRVVRDASVDEVLSDAQLLKERVISFPPMAEIRLRLGLANANSSRTQMIEALKPMVMRGRSARRRERDATVEGKVVVRVANLRHTFPPNVKALNGVDLAIHEGEFLAIIGQNGSGKTTLAYHLTGLLNPTNDDATVEVDGRSVRGTPISDLRRRVSYVFQNPRDQFFKETVRDELSYGLTTQGVNGAAAASAVAAYAKNFGIEGLLGLNIRQLSRFEASVVSLFSIAIMRPKVLLVDEPGAGADDYESRRIYEQLTEINREGITVVVITHDMRRVMEFASRVVVMSEGSVLLDGPPLTVFREEETLAKAWVKPPTVMSIAKDLERETGLGLEVRSVDDLCAVAQEGKGR